jgi:hypothetical protein
MAEKDRVYQGKMKYTGIWGFKETYRFVYDWFIDNDYDLIEKSYIERIKPDGKEVEIKWEAERKVSDYFKFQIKADWKITGLTEVEVQKEGVKVKMNKGTVEIRFTGTLIKDYESRWEDAPFLKFLRGVYDRYIIRARIEQYETKLFGEVDEVVSEAKSYLAVEGKK